MKVLFLGGPWDGTRQEVPDDLPRYLTLRGTLGGAPAYVVPGWPPPPKSCIVPGCTDPAREVFTASERGRLAGREWQPGDQINLCPSHASDVRRAQYVYGVDQLAEWLRPDARADLLDWVGLGLAAEEVAASLAHALRVRL